MTVSANIATMPRSGNAPCWAQVTIGTVATTGPDVRLHIQGTVCSNCGWQPAKLATGGTVNGRVVKPGDKLVVLQSKRQAPMPEWVSRSPKARTPATSTWSIKTAMRQHDNVSEVWHSLSSDLSAQAEKTVYVTYFLTDGETLPGAWSVDHRDFVYLAADGTIAQLMSGSGLSSAWMAQTSGEIAVSETAAPSGPYPGNAAPLHLYLGDHLGTAQMEMTAGEWPVWQGQFAPFGAELDTQIVDTLYKCTGKKRDAESGLDYLGARYYGSSMERSMSSDWSTTPIPIPFADINNPQRLDLYAHVGNNLLSRFDSYGLVVGDKAVICVYYPVTGANANETIANSNNHFDG